MKSAFCEENQKSLIYIIPFLSFLFSIYLFPYFAFLYYLFLTLIVFTFTMIFKFFN